MQHRRVRTAKKRAHGVANSLSPQWPGTESNRRHADFQSAALPTELPGLVAADSATYRRTNTAPPRKIGVPNVAAADEGVYPRRPELRDRAPLARVVRSRAGSIRISPRLVQCRALH